MDSLFSKRNLPLVILNISTILIVAVILMVNQALAKPHQVATSESFNSGVLSYQGTLTDSIGNPVTGSYEITFRIYNSPTSTTPLWEEVRSGANAVPVQNGLFNVMLGSLVPISDTAWESPELFLGVKIGSDAEMSPREKLTYVPGAVVANVAQLALSVPDGSITLSKLGEQPYYFSGAFATPTEWMADVIFNGNYHRFCEAIGRSYSRAETLTAHYTEPYTDEGRGNGYFYLDWYYVGTRAVSTDTHIYGNGIPDDPYNVWKYNGGPDYAMITRQWTFERSAIIWCGP